MESGGCDTTTIRRLTHSCAFRNSLVLLVQNLMLFWNVGGAALSHASFTAYDLDAVEIFAKIKRAWSLPPHVHQQCLDCCDAHSTSGVGHERPGRAGRGSGHVRFASKATVGHENAIRR